MLGRPGGFGGAVGLVRFTVLAFALLAPAAIFFGARTAAPAAFFAAAGLVLAFGGAFLGAGLDAMGPECSGRWAWCRTRPGGRLVSVVFVYRSVVTPRRLRGSAFYGKLDLGLRACPMRKGFAGCAICNPFANFFFQSHSSSSSCRFSFATTTIACTWRSWRRISAFSRASSWYRITALLASSISCMSRAWPAQAR